MDLGFPIADVRGELQLGIICVNTTSRKKFCKSVPKLFWNRGLKIIVSLFSVLTPVNMNSKGSDLIGAFL